MFWKAFGTTSGVVIGAAFSLVALSVASAVTAHLSGLINLHEWGELKKERRDATSNIDVTAH